MLGVHTDLRCSCLLLHEDTAPDSKCVAVISLDLVGVAAETATELNRLVRKHVLQRCAMLVSKCGCHSNRLVAAAVIGISSCSTSGYTVGLSREYFEILSTATYLHS